DALVFQPAEIFVSSRSVKVGEMIRFKCSVFEESDSSDQMNMFLCRNGVGVMMRLLGRKGEYTFIIKNVSELDSGNYSCVYSLNRYNLEEVKSSGLNSIHVQVTGNASVFQTAEIFVSSRSVKVGEMIRFKCSVFEESDSSDQMNMFLCRNGVGVMMRLLGRKGEYTFLIKNVSELDSGNYSCVYSLNRYNLEEVKSSGLNSIHVQVTDSQWWINLLRLFCSVGVLLFTCMIVVFDVYSTIRPG
ncbi:immunoglobulin superfamily member 1-like isoform X3, partial [Astyanax mexicanus]